MFGTMKSIFGLLRVLSLVTLVRLAASKCSYEQPTVVAPHTNPWKSLLEEEVASVNDLLQQKFSLTGNQGSR